MTLYENVIGNTKRFNLHVAFIVSTQYNVYGRQLSSDGTMPNKSTESMLLPLPLPFNCWNN